MVGGVVADVSGVLCDETKEVDVQLFVRSLTMVKDARKCSSIPPSLHRRQKMFNNTTIRSSICDLLIFTFIRVLFLFYEYVKSDALNCIHLWILGCGIVKIHPKLLKSTLSYSAYHHHPPLRYHHHYHHSLHHLSTHNSLSTTWKHDFHCSFWSKFFCFHLICLSRLTVISAVNEGVQLLLLL